MLLNQSFTNRYFGVLFLKSVFILHFCLLIIAILFLFTGSGCENDERPVDADNASYAPDDDADETDDDDLPDDVFGCPRHLVTSGFGLAWKNLNHRISLWDVHPLQPACPKSVKENTILNIGYIGGDFSTGDIMSDVPIYQYSGYAINTKNSLSFRSGAAELIVQPPDYTVEKEITLRGDQFGDQRSSTVLISGLTVDTDIEQIDPDYPDSYAPELGYTVRGMGVWIENIRVEEGRLQFSLQAKFEPGIGDRPAMNDAIRHARIRMKVYYTAVTMHQGIATTIEHGYLLEYPPPTFLIPQHIAHASENQREITISGYPGYGLAFCGFMGFDFSLFGDSGKGDYIREISINASLVDYEPFSGKTVLDIDGYASNSSLTAWETMKNDFLAKVTVVQFNSSWLSPINMSDQFTTGSANIPLP